MIYFDNAATTFPKPERVIDGVMQAISNPVGTPGRGIHEAAKRAGNIALKVRNDFAKFFNLLDDYRIIHTYSATDALNMALKGYINKGDAVVISSVEHNSVLRPLKGLERDGLISLHIAKCDREGYIDIKELEGLLKDIKPRLVAISHASNVTGAVQDVRAIGKLVRESGGYLLVDAAQSAGTINIDMREDYIDLLATSGHKGLYGLQGTGLLVIGERIFGLRPFREGGTGFDSESEYQPKPWPEAFEAGTHNMPGIIALYNGLTFINEVGVEKIHQKELEATKEIYNYFLNFQNVKLYGPDNFDMDRRVGILSFTIDGWEASDIVEILNQNYDIYLRGGLHCAALMHKALGTFPEGTVRVSPGYFNTEADIEGFCQAIKKIAQTKVPIF